MRTNNTHSPSRSSSFTRPDTNDLNFSIRFSNVWTRILELPGWNRLRLQSLSYQRSLQDAFSLFTQCSLPDSAGEPVFKVGNHHTYAILHERANHWNHVRIASDKNS